MTDDVLTHKYKQIANHFREEIVAGRLKPGDKLGSLDDLSQQFECAPETVRNAIAVLCADGFVESRHGRGTFVAESEEWQSTGSASDNLSASELMMIARLAEQRDEQFAEVNVKLDDLIQRVALISQKLMELTDE